MSHDENTAHLKLLDLIFAELLGRLGVVEGRVCIALMNFPELAALFPVHRTLPHQQGQVVLAEGPESLLACREKATFFHSIK